MASCKGRQQFAFNEWRENFDGAVNRGTDREANVRGLDTKVMSFYRKIKSEISGDAVVEGKRYISLLSYVLKKYNNMLAKNMNEVLKDKTKLKSECSGANESELVRKYEEVLNVLEALDEIEASDLAQVDDLINKVAMKAAEEEHRRQVAAEELPKKIQTEKDRAIRESVENIEKASQIGPQVAKEIGVEWQFDETKDLMTDAHIIKSEAVFEGEGQLSIYIEASCLIEDKVLTVTATAFDSSNNGVPFIQNNNAVNLLVRSNNGDPVYYTTNLTNYDNHLQQLRSLASAECINTVQQKPDALIKLASLQAGWMFSGQDPEQLTNQIIDEIIAEYPDASCMTIEDNIAWLELSELRVQFPLAHGNVVARIAPYEPNLRKVLETCGNS